MCIYCLYTVSLNMCYHTYVRGNKMTITKYIYLFFFIFFAEWYLGIKENEWPVLLPEIYKDYNSIEGIYGNTYGFKRKYFCDRMKKRRTVGSTYKYLYIYILYMRVSTCKLHSLKLNSCRSKSRSSILI